jgi:hypothetical protein
MVAPPSAIPAPDPTVTDSSPYVPQPPAPPYQSPSPPQSEAPPDWPPTDPFHPPPPDLSAMSALPAHAYALGEPAPQTPQQPDEDETMTSADEWPRPSSTTALTAPSALMYSRPSRPRRGPSPRALLACGVGLLVIALATTGVVVFSGSKSITTASEGKAQFAGRVFALDSAAATDGQDQQLAGVTAVDSTVVAVGGETDTIGDRGQFLVSTDGGRTYRLAPVRDAAGNEAAYGDTPRLVAGAPGAWVALGSRLADPAVWTSEDGTAWARQPDTAGALFGQTDRVFRLARTGSGFVAVGDTSTKGDHSDARPVVWLSGDGKRWERLADQQLAMSVSSGQVSLVDVTARGSTLITHALGATPGKKIGSIDTVWRSVDGGRTWEKAAISSPGGSFGFAMIATPSGFFIGRNIFNGGQHYAIVLKSSDARQWDPVGEIHVSGYGQLLRISGSDRGLVAAIEGNHKILLTRSKDGKSWQAAGEAAEPPQRSLVDIAATAGTTILVGSETGKGDTNAALAVLDSQGHQISVDFTKIKGAASADQLVDAMASSGGRTVAVGSTNGDAAIWNSADGRQWRRARTGITNHGRRRLVGVTSGPAGWLAVGYQMATAKQPLVITSSDGSSWLPDSSFESRPNSPLAPFAAASGPAGYVIVGEDSFSAAAWLSTDLKSWGRGTGAQAHDIVGTPSTGRWMHGVVAGPFGYVAVGGLNDPTVRDGPPTRPAVWASPDGRTWALHQLPLPGGADQATFQQAAARDNVILAAGTAAMPSGWKAFAFVSTDGGKTWQEPQLPGVANHSIVTALTATPRGFVIAGSTGLLGRTTVNLWVSGDGRSWSYVRAKGAVPSGNADQRLTALTPIGGQLVSTGLACDYLGEQPTLWRRPLP